MRLYRPIAHVATAYQWIAWETVFEVLPIIAGATYIEFKLSELKAGRYYQRGGTPDLNVQLWTNLQSPDAKSDLEKQLPGGRVDTKRFPMLSGPGWVSADEISDMAEQAVSAKVLDARSVAATMKKGLVGTLIQTHIA